MAPSLLSAWRNVGLKLRMPKRARICLHAVVNARLLADQIVAVSKEHEAGAKRPEAARKPGISEATIYNWKAKFGGMDVSEAKRLKAMEDENANLKKLLAEQMLDAAALREFLSKKWEGPPPSALRSRNLQAIMSLSERRAFTVRNRRASRKAAVIRALIRPVCDAVDDVKDAEAPTVGKLVVSEVQRPASIGLDLGTARCPELTDTVARVASPAGSYPTMTSGSLQCHARLA